MVPPAAGDPVLFDRDPAVRVWRPRNVFVEFTAFPVCVCWREQRALPLTVRALEGGLHRGAVEHVLLFELVWLFGVE